MDGLLVQKILRPGYDVAGRFIVNRKLEGTRGELYEAREKGSERGCIMKVFTEPPFGNPRIEENAMMLATRAMGIRHQNLVQVYAAGTFEEGTYIAMERAPGESLRALSEKPAAALISAFRPEERPRPSFAMAPSRSRNPFRDGMEWERALDVTLQACDALQALHENGIIHRALSPDKMMIGRDGGLKLLYSVLSKGPWPDFAEDGHFYGSYRYAAPEQYNMVHSYDRRVDVYAVGVTAYVLLTGTVPLFGDSFMEIRDRRSAMLPPPPSEARPEAGIPEAVDSLVLRATHPLPGDRFGSCSEMASAIMDVLSAGMN